MCLYQINEHNYRMHTEVIASYPWLKKGCRTRSAFLTKHGISSASCVYARAKQDQWVITSGASRRFDKLFIQAAIIDQLLQANPGRAISSKKVSSPSCQCGKKTTAYIYLIVIGTADRLRTSMAIDPKHPQASLVCKFGRTNDLDRRTKEHAKQYGSIPGAQFQLLYHIIVDARYASTAETSISHLVKRTDRSLPYLTTRELAIMTDDQLLSTLDYYDMLAKRYPRQTGLSALVSRKVQSIACQKCGAGVALGAIIRFVIVCLVALWCMHILA